MSDRERSRSRSRSPAPDNGAANNGPPDDKPHVDGGGGEDADGIKLYVGNLDYATDEPRLREVFGEFGQVTDMDQSQLDGRTIRVNESKPRGEGPADRSRGVGPGGAGGFNPTGREEVKLYVGNLSFETTEESVRGLFEQYGQVTDCFLPTDRDSGRVRGFAFVTMPAKEAETACSKTNGAELDGRTLRVNEAQPKGAGGGGGFGGEVGDSEEEEEDIRIVADMVVVAEEVEDGEEIAGAVEEVVDMEVEVATMIGEVEEDMVVGTMIGDRVDTMIGLEEEATEETVVGTEEEVDTKTLAEVEEGTAVVVATITVGREDTMMATLAAEEEVAAAATEEEGDTEDIKLLRALGNAIGVVDGVVVIV
eukprot:g11296.t1 g11296   contig5:544470-548123(+)